MRRSKHEALDPLLRGVRVQDDLVVGRHGEIPVRRYERSRPGAATLVWAHGGAFSHGGLDQLESHAVGAALAQRGIDVVAIDYRRVPPWSWFRDPPAGQLPGIRYPIPGHDVADVFEAVAARGGTIALGGASAGACLAATAACELRDAGRPLPAALMLAYGTFHAELPALADDVRRRVRGRHSFLQFRPPVVRRMNWNYAGSAAAMSEAFPGGGDLRRLPAALVLDADRDTLRTSGEAFAGELATAGVPVTHRVVRESTHGFLDRPGTAAFDAGICAIGETLLTHTTERHRS